MLQRLSAEAKDYLLQQTLEQTVQQNSLYSHLRHGNKLSFHDFPIIDKQFVVQNWSSFCNLQDWPTNIVLTSGSTGVPLKIPRTLSELDVNSFHAREMGAFSVSDISHGTFAIHLTDGKHGALYTESQPSPVIRLPMEDFGHVSAIASLLLDGLQFAGVKARCVTLFGNVSKFVALAEALLDLGVQPIACKLNCLYTRGYYILPKIRKYLEATWGCPIINSYGMSETSYSVMPICSICNCFCSHDSLICEAVPLDSSGVIGELVVTTLFPFYQALILVRYRTGDMVEVVDGNCACGSERRYRFVGRVRDALIRHDCWIGTNEICDIADDISNVLRPNYRYGNICRKSGRLPRSDALGPPLFAYRVNQVNDKTLLCVEIAPNAAFSLSDKNECIKRLHQLIESKKSGDFVQTTVEMSAVETLIPIRQRRI